MERNEHIEWLKQELQAWRHEKLLTDESARLIESHYGLIANESPQTICQLQIVRIIAALGAVLCGVGAGLVIGANWEALPKSARLAIIIGATAASYIAGFSLAHGRQRYMAVGEALILLGSLLYGAGILLISQMYHLSSSDGDVNGFLYWLAGVAPLAYILKSRVQMLLALGIGVSWLVAYYSEQTWMRQSGLYFACVMASCGCALYAFGLAHRGSVFDRLAPVFTIVGLGCSVFGLFFLSFHEVLKPEANRLIFSNAAWLMILAPVSATLAGAVLAIARTRERDGTVIAEGIVAGLFAIMITLVAAVYGLGYVTSSVDSGGICVLINLALFGLELALVVHGWHSHSPMAANIGLGLFFLQLMMRYVDLFAGMLPTGATFLGVGALLLVAGFGMERQRRRLADSIARRAQR